MAKDNAALLMNDCLGCTGVFRDYDGNGKPIGSGWITVNASTRVFQMQNSVILTHNGSSSKANMNLIKTITDEEELAGKLVTFSVEARVLKGNDKKLGGVIAFINANDYNQGEFYDKKVFSNTMWKTIFLQAFLPEKGDFHGLTLCLRAIVGEKEHAEVEFRNPRLYLGVMPNNQEYLEPEDEITVSLFTSVIPPILNRIKKRDEFINGLQSVISGYQIANRIVSDDERIHYLIMRKHIGDVMRMLKSVILFKNYYSTKEMYHFEEKYGNSIPKRWTVEKVIIVTNELLAGLTHLYSSVDDVVVLSNAELDCIANYAKSGMCIHKNLHRDEYGLFGEAVGEQVKSTMYKTGSYNWVLDLPMNLPDKNEWILSSIKIDSTSLIEAEKILSNHKTEPQKTVILCPYAQSSSMLSKECWHPIIHYLNQQGYSVYTNVGSREKELNGTFRLQIPVDVYAALGKLGCMVIGVQSGIIDVIRWMNNDTRLIDLGILLKPIDIKYAKNRNVRQPVDRKWNTTHLLIQEDEVEQFPEMLLEQFSYFRKGNLQWDAFVKERKKNAQELLYSAVQLNEYVKILAKMEHVLIFLSVCDTAHKYWKLFDRQSLGLESDLSVEDKLSYVAVIDRDSGVVAEKLNKDCSEVKIQDSFEDIVEPDGGGIDDIPKDNYYYVTSHAQGKGNYTKSAIVINGRQYSQNMSGLNIVVYDRQKACVIDSVCVDLGKDEVLGVKRCSKEVACVPKPLSRGKDAKGEPIIANPQQYEKFVSNISSVMRGFEIANRVVQDDMTTHYLIMNRHVGDDMRMLKDVILLKKYYSDMEPYYKEKEYGKLFRKIRVIKKAVVITDESHAGIARLFTSVDDIITLSGEELADIGFYAKSFICSHGNLHRDEYGSPGDWSEDLVKQQLFRVPSYRWVMDLPMDFPAADEWIISSIKVQEESLQKATEQMEDYPIPPYMRVVICPYAKSSSILPLKVWDAFISYCREKGFLVYINTASDTEEKLPDTLELHVSIDTLAAMGQMGCTIIGVQSGLTDVIRWMCNDTKLIVLSCLFTSYDKMLASNRKLKEKVEQRGNTTHLLLDKEDNASEYMISQMAQLFTGNIQREEFDHMEKGELLLYTRGNLNDYARELAGMEHVIIFFAVCDSANKYWNLFEKNILGLESDLSQEWRKSYVAVVDRDENFVYEEMGQNYREIRYQSSFLENNYYLSSHAMGKNHYTKCAIVINGQQYAMNQRGLNIVVFDKEKNSVIDSVYVDMWADRNLTVRR